jgi:shikimate dehydrogenase
VSVNIGGETRLVGIIGDPVAHSLSPAMHNAAFAALGLDFAFVPLPVPAARVAEAVAGLRALGFRGANVTMPHKAAVLPHLDEVSADARLIDAVNTIVVEGGRLSGHTTDAEGFARALHEVEPGGAAGRAVLLRGAGGAARAVALALAREGATSLTVADRTPAAAERLLERLGPRFGEAPLRAVPLDRLSVADVTAADLIVNATPLGIEGVLKLPSVVVDTLRRGHVVFDLVYGKRPTNLLTEARARGARAVDGLSMLVWQAAASFELWTGRPAPLDVMRSAVRARGERAQEEEAAP